MRLRMLALLLAVLTILSLTVPSQNSAQTTQTVCGQFQTDRWSDAPADWAPHLALCGSSSWVVWGEEFDDDFQFDWRVSPWPLEGLYGRIRDATLLDLGLPTGNLALMAYSSWEFISDCSVCNPAEISFTVDRSSITRGECTTLRWDVDNVQAVYLDEQGVSGHDTRQVCPIDTTTYTLRVVTHQGEVYRSVTVTVLNPTPTHPPQPTSTPMPTATPTNTPSPTAAATSTPVVTAIPSATAVAQSPTAPTPAPTGTPIAQYDDSDVRGPRPSDRPCVPPTQAFPLIWSITNVGTTSWESGYQWAWTGGERLGSDGAAYLPRLAPGEEVEVRVNFIAPPLPGAYDVQWQARDSHSQAFGAISQFSVDVCDTNTFAIPILCARWSNAHLPVPVYLDASIHKEWEGPIQAAIESWNAGVAPQRLLVYGGRKGVETGDHAIWISYYSDIMPPEKLAREEFADLVSPGYTQNYCRLGKELEIYSTFIPLHDYLTGDFDDVLVRRVVAHELGHALGLDHTDDATDLMYKDTSSGAQGPSIADYQTAVSLYFSGMGNLCEAGAPSLNLAGLPSIGCGQWCEDFASRWNLEFPEVAVPSRVMLASSRTGLIVTDDMGRRVGTLPDGTVVKEIPSSQVILTDMQQLVLLPLETSFSVQLRAAESSWLNVYVVSNRADRTLVERSYLDVPMNPGSVAAVNFEDVDSPIGIDSNGDGVFDLEHQPSSVTRTTRAIPPKQVVLIALSVVLLVTLTGTALIFALIFRARRRSLRFRTPGTARHESREEGRAERGSRRSQG